MNFFKIPLCELPENDYFSHNEIERAIIVAKTVNRYISELLQVYQDITHKTLTEIALDFDITLSNLYLYRTEKGNPRAKTIDKMISEVQARCPEAFDRVDRR